MIRSIGFVDAVDGVCELWVRIGHFQKVKVSGEMPIGDGMNSAVVPTDPGRHSAKTTRGVMAHSES